MFEGNNNVFDKAKLDVEFAEKLRKESPTQYNTLIKMHLSFLLDLNENEPEQSEKTKGKKNWLFPKKKATTTCSAANNVKSPEAMSSNLLLTDDCIKQLKILIKFLENDENLSQEGIFRKTGSVCRQAELKFLVNHMKPLNLEEFTCHDVASVLKSILADLSEPLLTETYFPAYSQVAEICNNKENDEHSRIKNSLQLLCMLLPIENRIALENLVSILHKASLKESQNKMTADTLATLFTPHLICPRKLQPEVLHQTAATMTRLISFMITSGSSIFLVPEKLSTDIRAYFVEQKRRRETPEKALDDSISDSVANTVFTFVDREKTAEAHASNTTDTALAHLYAYIQSLPESTKKKKLIKQFNKQNGQGTPLQLVNRDKPSSACRSIGDSIKKHIFHKTLHKTPKRDATNTPSSSNVPRTPLTMQAHPNKRILFQSPISSTIASSPMPEQLKPPQTTEIPTVASSSNIELTATSSCALKSSAESDLPKDLKNDATPGIPVRVNILNNHAEISHDDMIDDEDFCSSDEEDIQQEATSGPINQMEHKPLTTETPSKMSSLFKSRLLKGVSLGNLKFPFHTSTSTTLSPKMKKSKSSSILIDIEKDDEKRMQLMKSATESFDSEESDLFFSMCDATVKDHWHVDVSNINYFLNQTGAQEHPVVRNSMSPITKSAKRMPKSMQESIMTPRSRKPVMLAIFGNSDPKSYQNNISELLEESEEMQTENETSGKLPSVTPQTSCDSEIKSLLSKSKSDISTANDNGLPVAEPSGSNTSSSPDSLSSAFKDYISSRGLNTDCDLAHDDDSFSSQPDDFESSTEMSTEYQKLESSSSLSSHEEMEKIMNQSSMSESLLHCLDGNVESSVSPSPTKNRKRQHESPLKEDSSSESLKRPLMDNDSDL